ncbi:MAG TPA: peptidylprolyl isomerase, partial [Verrucomicrobiae bacterium]
GTIVQLTFSGYAGGGASNVVLQLFDYDKPATVENFIHYIETGAYTNMFWTRLVPGFVLQGGDYGAPNRTNGAPFQSYSIYSHYTVADLPTYPFWIDNEYGVGPQINNTFGTIAMAKTLGDPDSAVNTFFFNLADNSTNLDNQNGGFTVFGRILSGTNVLNYFNTFSQSTITDRIDTVDTNGIFDTGVLTDLPVDYHGLVYPGNSNLFYVDFNFLTSASVETNAPIVSVTYPPSDTTVTNADIIVTGTAADAIGVARVVVQDFTGASANNTAPRAPTVIGTTNWYFDTGVLPPDTYILEMVAQNGAGVISPAQLTTFTVPAFPFSVITNGPGKLSVNLNQVHTTVGSNYVVKAIPSAGAIFAGWTFGTNVSLSPKYSFTMPNGGVLAANFVPNTLAGDVAFTYPLANAKLATNSVVITGTTKPPAGQTTVTCQFFSKSTSNSVSAPIVVSSSGTWSIPANQFSPGTYIVEAVASNSLGKTTAISEQFTILTPLSVTVMGPGTTSLTNGQYLVPGSSYTIKATPKTGGLFYIWESGSGFTGKPSVTFTMTEGTAYSAIFISNNLSKVLSFTSPKANSEVTAASFTVTGSILASVANPQIICQPYSNGIPVGAQQAATINGTTWSVPMSLPQGTYTVVAVASDSAGHQTMASESFKVLFYPNIAGAYYGIFLATNIAPTTCGYMAMTVNASGAVSGILQFPLRTYSITWSLGTSGDTGWLAGSGFDGPSGPDVYFNIQFDLTNGTDSAAGYVYWKGTFADLVAYRGVKTLPTNTLAGKYMLSLETLTNLATSDPTNDGYAALSVSSTGTMTVAGTLADNSTFSHTTGISKDGVWPFYSTLYGGGGLILGWETNVIGPSSGSSGSLGTLFWVKPSGHGPYYPNALGIIASSIGTNYVAPVNGSQYEVVFSGGTINPAVSNLLTVTKGKFVPAASASDKLTITLSASGAITGTIHNAANNKTLPIRGSFTSPPVGGSGFVLDTDGQADPFQIVPVQ